MKKKRKEVVGNGTNKQSQSNGKAQAGCDRLSLAFEFLFDYQKMVAICCKL
jgi:hypothetical protein